MSLAYTIGVDISYTKHNKFYELHMAKIM